MTIGIFLLSVGFLNLLSSKSASGSLTIYEELLYVEDYSELNDINATVTTVNVSQTIHDELTYTPLYTLASEFIKFIKLDKHNAEIQLKQKLDADDRSLINFKYEFKFLIEGGGQAYQRDLKVYVKDENDEIPRFISPKTVFKIDENNDVTHFVCSFVVRDNDITPDFSYITFSLQSDTFNANDIFYLTTISHVGGSSSGAVVELYLNKSLDYEEEKYYFFSINATDGKEGTIIRNNATLNLVFEVQDVQDMPPEFIKFKPIANVKEDVPLGPIEHFTAVDGDKGKPNPIEYFITSFVPATGREYFEINNNDGTVSLIKSFLDLDLQNNLMFVLQIMAQEYVGNDSYRVYGDNTTVSFTIVIEDVNNNSPTFKEDCILAEIEENSGMNVPIHFTDGCQNGITIIDKDLGNNAKFETYLKHSNDTFYLVPQSGINEAIFLVKVKENQLLDYEKWQHVSFQMFAKETETAEKFYNFKNITVNIINVNDHSPIFKPEVYNFSFFEKPSAGSWVGKVEATDKDLDIFGVVAYTKLHGSAETKLTLDYTTGNITITKDDTEKFFNRERIAQLFLTVEAEDNNGTLPNNKAIAQIHITLLDINDNAPVFTQGLYEARLVENSPNFEKPLILMATDADEGENAIVNYEIIAGNELNNFTIDSVNGTITPTNPVDFEAMNPHPNSQQRWFNLTVRAFDLGIPMQSSTVFVIIYVEDVNDNAPIFEKDIYYSEINETINLNNEGQLVTTVMANDADGTSPYNKVTYMILTGSENKFMMKYEDVVVISSAQLDYDVKRNYILTVIGLDGGAGLQQLNGTCIVNVNIKDMNNKDPKFNERKATVQILEDKPVGFLLTNMTALDVDSTALLHYSINSYDDPQDENGNILTMEEYDYEQLFRVDESNGFIYVNSILDRESMEKIKLILLVEDKNADTDHKQTSTATLTINIEDVNDHDPEFDFFPYNEYYMKSVYENSYNDTPVLTFSAKDRDKNRTITYSFTDNNDIAAKLFSLDPKLGQLVVKGFPQIDREMNEWFNFTINATDNGVPTRSSMADVAIYVIDLNDNAPNFTHYENSVAIKEHEPIGTYLTHVSAYDPDTGAFGHVSYFVDQSAFFMDRDNGNISVHEDIDREKIAFYNLRVVAKDNYNDFNLNSNSAEVMIYVKIIDINDNAPKITPKVGCYEINEDQKINVSFAKIEATDDDEKGNVNSQFELFLAEDSRNDSNYFHITTEGNLFIKYSILDKVGNYFITVIATDLGEPPLSSNQTFIICVNDINNHRPIIHKPEEGQVIPILQSETATTFSFQVNATDDDFLEINKKLKFKLEDKGNADDKTFSVDDLKGTIYLTGVLDIQKKREYQLQLTVSDHGLPTPLQSDSRMFKFVIVLNDSTPYFNLRENKFNLTEHKKGPELIGIIEAAKFLDEHYISLQICYFIVGGDDKDDNFILHKKNRTLKLKEGKDVDREEKAVYNLVILATANYKDCVDDSLTSDPIEFDEKNKSMIQVRIDIDDINDQPPIFTKRKYSAGTEVTAAFDTIIPVGLAITDADEPHNAVNYFYILGVIDFTPVDNSPVINSAVPVFRVDKLKGEVYVNVVFERSLSGYFNFEVIANDSTDGNLNDTAHVSIYLLRDNQKARITIMASSAVFLQYKEEFISIVNDITGGTVNIDEIKSSQEKVNGTDVFFHVIKNEKIMNPGEVFRLMDENIEKLYEIKFKLKIDTLGYKGSEETTNTTNIWQFLAIGLSAGLGFLLLLVVSICLAQRSWYRRKVKASTVKSFADAESLDTNQLVVPGTNIHQFEGSNPVWQQNSYNNMWLREEDNLSLRSGNESLDNNVVLSGNPNPAKTNPLFNSYKPTENKTFDSNSKPPDYEESESYHRKPLQERSYSIDL